ncbi:MAG: lamin tail domain-containing protein, partial [bacterium]
MISCGDNSTGPTSVVPFHVAPRSVTSVPLAGSRVVISQVYGGGGNSGATYKNDFIELYNGGTDSVDLSGSSVQY